MAGTPGEAVGVETATVWAGQAGYGESRQGRNIRHLSSAACERTFASELNRFTPMCVCTVLYLC